MDNYFKILLTYQTISRASAGNAAGFGPRITEFGYLPFNLFRHFLKHKAPKRIRKGIKPTAYQWLIEWFSTDEAIGKCGVPTALIPGPSGLVRTALSTFDEA